MDVDGEEDEEAEFGALAFGDYGDDGDSSGSNPDWDEDDDSDVAQETPSKTVPKKPPPPAKQHRDTEANFNRKNEPVRDTVIFSRS